MMKTGAASRFAALGEAVIERDPQPAECDRGIAGRAGGGLQLGAGLGPAACHQQRRGALRPPGEALPARRGGAGQYRQSLFGLTIHQQQVGEVQARRTGST